MGTMLSVTEKLDDMLSQLHMLRMGLIFMIALVMVVFLGWIIVDNRRSGH